MNARKEYEANFNGYMIKFEYPIRQLARFDDLYLVLLDPDSFTGSGKFENLMAYTKNGKKKWVADLPNDQTAYYQFKSGSPIIADTFSSHTCYINNFDGKIIRTEFYK